MKLSTTTVESDNTKLRAIFDDRLARVSRIARACPDAERFTLALIVKRWSIQAYFELLDKLLQTTPVNQLNGWMANFTKILVYTGNPQSPYIAPHLSITSDNAQCGLVLIEAGDRVPHFLRLLKPLSTNKPLTDFHHQHAAKIEVKLADKDNDNRPSVIPHRQATQSNYTLFIKNDALRLEQLIVDCTHSYCEYWLINEVKAPLPLRLVLATRPVPRDIGENPYFRVIASPAESTLSLRAVLYSTPITNEIDGQ